jgi:hypothetical protein
MQNVSMEKWIKGGAALLAACAAAMMFMGCEKNDNPAPAPESPTTKVSSAREGNGAPSGAHYTLNIIGVPKNKTADMTNNSGHRIPGSSWLS